MGVRPGNTYQRAESGSGRVSQAAVSLWVGVVLFLFLRDFLKGPCLAVKKETSPFLCVLLSPVPSSCAHEASITLQPLSSTLCVLRRFYQDTFGAEMKLSNSPPVALSPVGSKAISYALLRCLVYQTAPETINKYFLNK